MFSWFSVSANSLDLVASLYSLMPNISIAARCLEYKNSVSSVVVKLQAPVLGGNST